MQVSGPSPHRFRTMSVAQFNYLVNEIRELAQFPNIKAEEVEAEMERAGGNVAKLTDLYDRLMEDCYGDDANY